MVCEVKQLSAYKQKTFVYNGTQSLHGLLYGWMVGPGWPVVYYQLVEITATEREGRESSKGIC